MNKICKRALALCMTGALVFSLAACGNKNESSSTAPATEGSTAAAESSPATTSGEKMKVVLCIGRKNDLSFQQSAFEGSQRVAAELGDKYEVEVVEMGDDTTIWESAFYEAADSGADFVVGVGYQNKGNFEKIPLEYPDTKFILFDQDVDYASGDLSNVLTVLFDSNESGFLAGAVAAYYTVSEKAANPDKTVGFIGGIDAVTINNFLVGYAEGARYVDPETKVMTAYIGDFVDTAKAKDLAVAQISEGADILFQVAGGAGNGVIEAAAEKEGIMAIGVDADQYETLAGTNLQPAIITSSLKRLDNALFKILNDYANDSASIAFGSTVTYGLGEDAVGIVFNDNLTQNLGEENIQKVKDILAKIQAGEIQVSQASKLTSEEIQAIVQGK